MSLSQPSESWPEAATLRWIGYALGAAGALATVMRAVQPGPLWTAALLFSAVASLTLLVRAPEAFETRWRGGRWGPNVLVGSPSAFLFAIALGQQVDDIALPVAGAAIAAAALLAATTRSFARPGLKAPIADQVMTAVLAAALGYGAVVALDVDYDLSAPTVLPVQVLDKYVTRSRSSSTYHLRVPAFGARPNPSSVTVKYKAYMALKPGDVVCVLEHRGALGLSWVSAGLCAP